MTHVSRWTAEKIARRLELIELRVYRQRWPLPPFQYQALSSTGEIDETASTTIEPNTYWGAWQTDFVLRTPFQIPSDWTSAAPIALFLSLGEAGDFSHPEALICLDGQAWAASDRHHQEIRLPDAVADGQLHQLTLHGWTGLGGSLSGDSFSQLLMRPCALLQIDQPLRDFVATARVALGVAQHLDENAPARHVLLTALDTAFKRLNIREPIGAALYASIPIAKAALQAGIVQAGAPLDVAVYAAGHAHINMAWLWTFAQTRRKAARTFHTVLRLIEQFPDYHFTQSQQRVAEGRWEPIRGMWVEADCNLSGAEALARQFVLRLSLLRAPTEPDPDADQGEYTFTYSLLPHAGTWEMATPREAYALNDPLIVRMKVEGGHLHRAALDAAQARAKESSLRPLHFIQCDTPNIIIETIKQAEIDDGIIVRLYESQRRRGPITLTTVFALRGAWVTNLLEENQREIAVQGHRVELAVRPFEIVTLRLRSTPLSY